MSELGHPSIYVLGRLDEVCMFVTAIMFFGGWLFLGKESSITITSGCVMFGSMFAWFFIAALDQFFSIPADDDDDFYDE